MKISYIISLFIFISGFGQEIDYKNINFLENDAVIYSVVKSENFISEVEVIILLDERVKGVNKVDDLYSLCMSFGAYISDDEFTTKGQQCFIPVENKVFSKDKTRFIDIKYEQEKYLYLKFDISELELKNIDGFYIYFHLRDIDREPILRYNTEVFFYRSKKAKHLKLYEDTSGFKSAYKTN